MKSFILRAGLFTCLIFLGWSYEQASAATTWPSKCTYGENIPNQNPSPQQINCLLTNAALEADIPPEVVKAVAEQESGWKQFVDGQPFVSQDGGIGIMQITNQPTYDQDQLKNDIYYNIQAGVEILSNLYKRTGVDLPKIKDAGRDVIENWYFPVMAYNGTKPVNSPLFQADGSKNTNAYQEQVFAKIEDGSFLGGTPLAQFPFSTADFDYQTNSDQNIKFNNLEYTVTDQMHASRYSFQTGDKVVVTMDGVKFRSQPSTSSSSTVLQLLPKNTTLTIKGNFLYDLSISNKFVWYQVTTADQQTGYISSAYIMKKLDAPEVSSVNDHDVSFTGKAPLANVSIQIMNGTLPVGSTVADATGNFKVDIPAQKAGTNLTVTYKDNLNALSQPTNITVQHYVLNGWTTQNGKRYHNTNGVVNTGWFKDGAYYYYLDPSNGGAMKTGWLKYGNAWFYLGTNGIMQTGWVKYGQDWYYLASNGKMLTGWQKISGKWYYLYSNGKMAHDTRIGKYRIGHNGAMI